MIRMEIPLADYQEALNNATDEGYRQHLLNDFVIRENVVYPRVDFVQVNTVWTQRR